MAKISNPYDYGSVVPRFHGERHRQQMVGLLVNEGHRLQGLPWFIAYPLQVYLHNALIALDEDDALGFVENFYKEDSYLSAIRNLVKGMTSKRRMQRTLPERCTLDRQQDDNPEDDYPSKL